MINTLKFGGDYSDALERQKSDSSRKLVKIDSNLNNTKYV